MMNHTKSLEIWNKYGEYVLMATEYQDTVIAEGQGCVIKDIDGNEFLDMSSGQICALLGHNHPDLIQKINEQMKRILHTGTAFLSPSVFEASARIAEVAPGNLKKSIFLSTGAEANECAFRLAKAYTEKNGIAAFTRGYAGLTLATASASNYGKGAFPTVPESYYILTPDCLRCPVEAKYPDCNILCLKVSKDLLSGARQKIAAIIFEPILSAGGMIIPPPDYFKALKNLADEFEALLIADEAQTFGRTGKWFGVEHYEVVPDILVASKGIGGGFPTSCIVVTDTIANEVTGKWGHFSSHQSDSVAAAAAAAVIDVIKKEGLVEKAAEKGIYLLRGLREVSERYPHIANIRGKGLMVGFDVFEDSTAQKPSETLGYILKYACRQKGVHVECIQNGVTFRILPSLTITYEQIDRFLFVLDEAMKETLEGKHSLNDTLPKNSYTKALDLKKRKTFKATVNRLWETSPKYWVDKLKEKVT